MIKDWFTKNKDEKTKQLPYVPLSPTDNAEDCDVYLDALSWALANKKQIKNIAISGPYGSGKSSIIQTFIKKEELQSSNYRKWFSKRNHFLNISLATFEPPKAQENGKEAEKTAKQIESNDVQRLIELSLLQQLFFRETNSKTPDSRLKKIQRQKSWALVIQSIGVMIFILSTMALFVPDKLDTFLKLKEFTFLCPIVKYIALVTFLSILFFIIYKSSRSIISLSIKKLNLQGAEIEIDKNISKSILNNHIDEIIYFFEATNYNVVIIEDLDRFGDSEVFTKLREINLLINNSKKITRDIVFIYAIKDDMFHDKDRAKFFDYMLPVIPIVNFSNSGDKLKAMLANSSTKIDNDLIEDLSLFIDDMRLLYNIMNEFYVYSKKVSEQLDLNKLLAIIVYKNLFPKDFTELSENKGDLFDTINQKSIYIQDAIDKVNSEIQGIKERIRISEDSFISNIKDLRTLYVSKAIESINNKFMGFKAGDKDITLLDFTVDKYFPIIKSGSIEYYYYNDNYYGKRSTTHSFTFSEIEKQVHPTLSYTKREAILNDKKKCNDLKKEIEQLNIQKDIIRKSKLKDILSTRKVSILTGKDRKHELIDILLRNGYINENYLDYISIFHEGALSKSDYQFLINVKRELSPQFDYTLNKKDELLKRLSLYLFEKDCILNFDIIDTLLVSNLEDKKEVLFKQLTNEQEETIRFINEYIDRSNEQDLFVKKLCAYWPNMWKYILSKSNFTDERKDDYFLLIMKCANIDDLKKIFDENDSFIANYREFFNISMDNKFRRELIEYLGIIFKTINPSSPKEDLQFLLDYCYYEINCDMLKAIIPEDKLDEQLFFLKNYTFVKHSGLESMIEYIEEEINTYIENILLKLEGNTQENLGEYTLLLNNTELKMSLKEKLIQKTETTVEDISTIDGLEEAHLLFKSYKVEPNWNNIQYIFEKESNILSEEVITFLNNENNALELSKSRMSTESNDDGVQIFNPLCKAIIHEKRIKDISYGLFLKSIPWCYSSFDSNSITKGRMETLITNNKVNSSIESYNFLRQNYKGLNIQLIEKYPSKFNDLLDKTMLDETDMELILKSSKLDNLNKFKYINIVDDNAIINSTFNSSFVIQNVLSDKNKYNISDTLNLKLINKKDLPTTQRINLFSMIYENLDNEIINSFLISLGNPYKEIADQKKNPEIERNSLNEMLMEILKNRNIISNYSKKNNRVYHSN